MATDNENKFRILVELEEVMRALPTESEEDVRENRRTIAALRRAQRIISKRAVKEVRHDR